MAEVVRLLRPELGPWADRVDGEKKGTKEAEEQRQDIEEEDWLAAV